MAKAPGCVTADGAVALLQMDVLGLNISLGCRTVVDLGGYSYALLDGSCPDGWTRCDNEKP